MSKSYAQMLSIVENADDCLPSSVAKPDSFGNTVLHYLALYAKVAYAKYLKISPASWSVKNNLGFTPLDYVRDEEFEHLPFSPTFQVILGSRWTKYQAIQECQTLFNPKETTTIDLF